MPNSPAPTNAPEKPADVRQQHQQATRSVPRTPLEESTTKRKLDFDN
jgi:hypothetical protein